MYIKIKIAFIIVILVAATVFLYLNEVFTTLTYNKSTIRTPPYNFLNDIPEILQPTVCIGDVHHDIVILVTSYVGHVELRNAHRHAISLRTLRLFNATRLFLLAQIPPYERVITQQAIENKHNRFGDIYQAGFIENYRNLTIKHLLGLKWVSYYCKKSTFIIKVDDDIVFNLKIIVNKLNEYRNLNKKELLAGYLLDNMVPHRNRENKWYVSYAEYPRSSYPSFLSGWMYITTPQVATKLVTASKDSQYFWIDDIFVTGILAESINLELIDMKSDHLWLEYYELLQCCLRDMINFKIHCEYAIGPNGGDVNMILEFYGALKVCDANKNCTKRQRSLNETCIVNKKTMQMESGQSAVEAVQL